MDIPIPPPIRGVNENLAFSAQPPDTCRDARNMRGQDSPTGRIRPAQRSGTSKANTTAIVSSKKVAELARVVFDNRNVAYDFTGGSEVVEWQVSTPSMETCRGGTIDDQGNVYVLDGAAAVVKLNSDNAVVWQFPLPTKDEADIIRWVHVDDLLDVYVGVSDGRLQSETRIWKLRQLPDDEVEIAWEFAPDAYTEDGIVYRDKLYTIQNDRRAKIAYVRVYEVLDSTSPQEARQWEIGYPAIDLAINSAGEVLTTAPRGDDYFGTNLNVVVKHQRAQPPQFPDFGPGGEDWTPYDLEDADRRIWSWYEPDDIDEFDVVGDLEEGARVLRLRDRSGHDRHFFADFFSGNQAPLWVKNAAPGHAGLRFNGAPNGGAMITQKNVSLTKEMADSQKTAIPVYTGAMWCSVMVVRIEDRIGGFPHCIWAQKNAAAFKDHLLVANRAEGAVIPGAFATGEVSWFCDTDIGDAGAGASGQPWGQSFVNKNDIAIIVQLHDGGVEGGNSGTGFTRSMFNINGGHVDAGNNRIPDRFEGEELTSLDFTYLGRKPDGAAANLDPFRGELLAWIVLDRKDRRDDSTEPKILTHDAIPDSGFGAQTAANELTRIVGYFAHRFRVPHVLPDDQAPASEYPHPYGVEGTGSATKTGPPPDGASGDAAKLEKSWGLLSKWSATGDLIWCLNEDEVEPDGGAKNVGGVGYAIAVNSEDDIYCIGSLAYTNAGFSVIKVIDQGATFSVAVVDGYWGVNGGTLTYDFPDVSVDAKDNLIYSKPEGHGGGAELKVYKKDGTLLSDVDIGTGPFGRGTAADPRVPDYDGDLTDEMAEFIYAFTDNNAGATSPTVHKVRLVTIAAKTGSPRADKLVGISGDGSIKTFAVAGGGPVTPSGAPGKLASNARYIQSAIFHGEVFISDGLSPIAVYNPMDDDVTVLKATDSGKAPHRAKILEVWSDRLVGCRAVGLIDEAFNWAMSQKGDARKWDKFHPDRAPHRAIAGDNIRGPGMVPDIVNGFIPYNDDLAFFLCDRSIWMLTGDPGDGGHFDLVSDEWGGAFGRAWAKDPEGNVYFFGSRGGLFKMPPGAIPDRITKNNIERQLRTLVNLGTHYIRMAWNDEDEGLHIIQCPFGDPTGALLTHWFWDTKVLAPWPDVFGTSASQAVQPTAVLGIDGDAAADRLTLFGCEDGFVRKWDKNVRDDDGTATDAFILMGPFAGSDVQREMRFVGPRVVLADDQNGATFELFATDEADRLGTARETGSLTPGRNGMRRTRVRGSYCFLRIRNAQINQRFAIEEMAIAAYPAGPKRVREEVL